MVSSSPNSPEMSVGSAEMSELMATAVLISALGWMLVMMMEASSSRGILSLDDKFFLGLSREIGRNWKNLAIYLGFRSAQIDAFQEDNRDNLQEQCRQMLVAWHRDQSDDDEGARKKLEQSLIRLGRRDLANVITGKRGLGQKATSGNLAQDAADRCQQALKGRYKTTGSYVQIMPWVPDDMKHIMDIYTKLELVKDNNDVEGNVIVYDDVFLVKTREGHPVKLAICSGSPGVGKSTLIDKIAYDWAEGKSKTLHKYELVFVLKMYKLEQRSDLIDAVFDQLLPQDTTINRSDLKSFIDNNQDKVLILLDGFDEFMTTDLVDSKFGSILKILNRKMLTEINVLVTSRPSHYSTLVSKSLIEKPFCHVKVLGFSKEDIEQYINKFFSGEAEKVNRLVERISSSEVLSDLATSPMMLLLMCLLWREDTTLPDTMSRLYDKSVEYIFRRKELTGVSDIVVAIGKIALDGLLPPKKRRSIWTRVFKAVTGLFFGQETIDVTTQERLSFQELEFETRILNKALKAGILTIQRVMKGLDTDNNVHFSHKTFQEFCAAKYCQNLVKTGAGKFQKILDRIIHLEDMDYFLRFCCGDNEPCTNAILKILDKVKHGKRSVDTWLKLTMLCYFECQTKKLPPVDVISSVSSDELHIRRFTSDHLTSLCYFLESLGNQSGGEEHLARVRCIKIEHCDFWRCGNLLRQFQQMPNLQTLEVSSCLQTPDGIAPAELLCGVSSKVGFKQALFSLQQLQQLRELILCNLNVTTEAMKHIADTLSQMPKLVELELSRNRLIDCSFIHLKEMKYIQKLDLRLSIVMSEEMKWIAKSMPNLLVLYISQENPCALCPYLKEMKNLQQLSLWFSSWEGVDLDHFAESLYKMPNLSELNLPGNKALSGSFVHLKEMRHLYNPNVHDCRLTAENLKSIAETTIKLIESDLSHNHPILGPSRFLKKIVCLYQKLKMTDCRLTDEELKDMAKTMLKLIELENSCQEAHFRSSSPFKKIKHLHKLNVKDCRLAGEDLKNIAESMPNLVDLNLSCNEALGGSYSHLNEMKHLHKLSVRDCRLTGEDLKNISESMPDLVELDLSCNEALGGSFSHLKEMKHLNELNVNDCRLTGEDLKNISESMPNLVELDLSSYWSYEISDSFSHLKEMQYLQTLKLKNGRFTGEDLKHNC